MDLIVKLQGVVVPERYCIEPLETVHVKVAGPIQRPLLPSGSVVPEDSVTYVSDILHPDPVTVTGVPVGPMLGVNVIVATETVKVREIGPCCT